MPRAVFSVSIINVHADGLAPGGSVDHSLDSYLKIAFAGEYKKIQSEVAKSTCNPVYQLGQGASFVFNTNFGHRLDAKSVDVEVWKKNSLFADELVGSASVDLHTVATGPDLQSLTLRDASQRAVGTIEFEIDMVERCNDMKARLIGCTAALQGVNGDQGNLMSLSYHFTSAENVELKSSIVPPSSMQPLVGSDFVCELLPCGGSLEDLEQAAVIVSVNLEAGGRTRKLADARIQLAKYYQVGQAAVPFRETLYANRAPCGELTGLIQMSDGPSYAQMHGGRNTSAGVEPGSQRFSTMPLPTKMLGAPSAQGAPMPKRVSAVMGPPSPRGDHLPAQLQAAPASAPPPRSPRVEASASSPNMPPTLGNMPPVISLTGSQRSSGGSLQLPASAAQPSKPVAVPVHVQQQPVIQIPQGGAAAPRPVINVEPHPRHKLPYDDVSPMPKGWGFAVNAQGMVYFKYHEAKQTSWQDPRLLPAGFEQRLTADGKMFFAYAPTKSTTWIDPRGLPAGWSVGMVPGDPHLVYTDAKSGFRTHVDPRGLPPGHHQSVADASGKVYFKIDATRSTSWDDPRAHMSADQLRQFRTAQRQAWDSAAMQHVVDEARRSDPVQEFETTMNAQLKDLEAQRARWEREQTSVWQAQERSFDESCAAELKAAKLAHAATAARQAQELKQWEDEYMAAFRSAKAAKQAELAAAAEAAAVAAGVPTEASVTAKKTAWKSHFATEKASALAAKQAEVAAAQAKLHAGFDAFLVQLEGGAVAAAAANMPPVVAAVAAATSPAAAGLNAPVGAAQVHAGVQVAAPAALHSPSGQAQEAPLPVVVAAAAAAAAPTVVASEASHMPPVLQSVSSSSLSPVAHPEAPKALHAPGGVEQQ